MPPFSDRNEDNVTVEVKDLEMRYGGYLVMKDVNFDIQPGEIFVIMGGSGCGKSTLMKHMLGLLEPARGEVVYGGQSFTHSSPEDRDQMLRQFGVLYQGGALWSSMTLAENIALPLEEYSHLDKNDIYDVVRYKLALVGLRGFEDFYPSELSGGMRKRAALARAMALDPKILFFDEPSAGLDPISSHRLDDLILQIRDSLGTTIVIVTHELPSIFAIADRAIYLNAKTKTVGAVGVPNKLLDETRDPMVREFLTRGEED